MTACPVMLTDDEQFLLAHLSCDVGRLIATPAAAISAFRDGHCSGGGGGWEYRFTKKGIEITLYEWLINTRFDPGWCPRDCERKDTHAADGFQHVKNWRRGRVELQATITYGRLQRWAEQLPQDIRDRALIAWRTWPENTRDLAELRRIALEALQLSATRLPATYPGEIPGQEALF